MCIRDRYSRELHTGEGGEVNCLPFPCCRGFPGACRMPSVQTSAGRSTSAIFPRSSSTSSAVAVGGGSQSRHVVFANTPQQRNVPVPRGMAPGSIGQQRPATVVCKR